MTLLGGATPVWPLAARVQQADRMRRVGILSGFAAGDPEFSRRLTAFVQTLQQLGWTEGRDVRIDYRSGAADAGTESVHAMTKSTLRAPIGWPHFADASRVC